jgi:SAM-dependent methyltransferase
MSSGRSWFGKRQRDGRPAAASQGEKVVLHVGCGPPDPRNLHPTFHGPEWRELRLDIDPRVEPDIIGTTVDMAGVKRTSVDAVWSSHNLEHVYAHEVLVVLREFFRVLRPGGFALITVPDLQKVAEVIATGNLEGVYYKAPAGPVAALEVVYGHGSSIAKGNEFMAHRTGFTAETLEHKLGLAGFEAVEITRREIAELWARAQKPG